MLLETLVIAGQLTHTTIPDCTQETEPGQVCRMPATAFKIPLYDRLGIAGQVLVVPPPRLPMGDPLRSFTFHFAGAYSRCGDPAPTILSTFGQITTTCP